MIEASLWTGVTQMLRRDGWYTIVTSADLTLDQGLIGVSMVVGIHIAGAYYNLPFFCLVSSLWLTRSCRTRSGRAS